MALIVKSEDCTLREDPDSRSRGTLSVWDELFQPTRESFGNRQDAPDDYRLVSVVLLDDATFARTIAWDVDAELRLGGFAPLIGRVSEGLAVLTTAKDAYELMKAHSLLAKMAENADKPYVVASGHALRGESAAAISFEQAQSVLGLFEDRPELRQSMAFHDALPYLLLTGNPTKIAPQIVALLIAPFLSQPNAAVYLETVSTFFSCGSHAEAAEKLHIVRQSLYERIWRIQGFTGLSFEDRSGQLLYQLALRAHRLGFGP